MTENTVTTKTLSYSYNDILELVRKDLLKKKIKFSNDNIDFSGIKNYYREPGDLEDDLKEDALIITIYK